MSEKYNSEFAKRFGDNLRKILLTQNLSIYRFARDVGLSESTIRNYLEGSAQPSLWTLYRIADKLNISIDAIVPKNPAK